jgi:hypothetical protein
MACFSPELDSKFGFWELKCKTLTNMFAVYIAKPGFKLTERIYRSYITD